MQIHFKRSFYSRIRSKLPIHLRSIEDFYFLSFSLSAIFWLLVLCPFFAASGQDRASWSALVMALLISLSLCLWRLGLSIPWTQCIFQATLMWGIIYNAFYSGGITSPVMVWMGIVPILPLFTVSRRWSYTWLIISFTSVVLIYWAHLQNLIALEQSKTPNELILNASMIGLLCVTQVMLVMTYDSANSQNLLNFKRKNEKLKTLSQDLQLANIHKDRFLATVSHEMRTPLNAIMGYIDLLSTTNDMPPLASRYIQSAQNSAAHLLTVINDLLDYSQIHQGKLVFTPQTVNLHQVLKDTHQTLAPKAAEQALSYELDIAANLPIWVRIDPHRFAQIFLNLLGNALKFTKQGAVITHIRFDPHPTGTKSGQLILQVQDTGIGIPNESIAHVF